MAPPPVRSACCEKGRKQGCPQPTRGLHDMCDARTRVTHRHAWCTGTHSPQVRWHTSMWCTDTGGSQAHAHTSSAIARGQSASRTQKMVLQPMCKNAQGHSKAAQKQQIKRVQGITQHNERTYLFNLLGCSFSSHGSLPSNLQVKAASTGHFLIKKKSGCPVHN